MCGDCIFLLDGICREAAALIVAVQFGCELLETILGLNSENASANVAKSDYWFVTHPAGIDCGDGLEAGQADWCSV
ncbi:hypothetical protein OAL43_02815 [bacterium]|nr:hypothetical protein [bacterium]